MKNVKKFLSVILAVALLGLTSVTAFAANPSQPAKFYLLKEGLNIPVGTASEPSANYTFAGEGRVSCTNPNGVYKLSGVAKVYLPEIPNIDLKPGEKVIWYVVKWEEGDGWHVDGVIVPFYSVLYNANGEDVTGATSDPTHYAEDSVITVKENGFERAGYTFKGWNTKADGTGLSVAAGSTVDTKSKAFVKNEAIDINVMTLYAQWEKVVEKPVDPNTLPQYTDKSTGNKTANLKIVVPKKMAVRFDDGTVYYGGESIKIDIGRTYYFQMCSVNWDNGIYDDYGNGICGTVVYSVRVSDKYDERSFDEAAKAFVLPKGDPVLRTDVNKCFMAYRYHFKKGDYNKQTGIEQVVNVPLESLSVNLPLGATITSDAYKAMKWIDTADVFIENNNGKGIYNSVYMTSVNDYYWKH